MSQHARVDVSDWNLAKQIGEHVQIGHYFVFVSDGKALKPSGRMGRLLGYRAAAARSTLPLTDTPVELAGLALHPPAREMSRLACLVSDRDLYRAEQDTVHLFVALPNAPSGLMMLIEHNGSHFSRRALDLGVEGVGIEPLSMLLPGQYTAVLEHQGQRLGPEARFTVAEYSLAPLSARLAAHQLLRGSGQLRFELEVESYQVPYTQPLRVELRDRDALISTIDLSSVTPGRYSGQLRLSGEGPFRLRLTDVEDPARVAEAPLPGARREERDTTVVSELGRELLMSLMPEPSAIPVRGAYLTEGDHLATPLTVEEIVVEEGRIRAHLDLESVTLVIADLASGGFESVSLGDVKKGTEIPVHLPGPACTVFVGCFIDGHPFEGYTSFLRRQRLNLAVSLPQKARPREEVEIRLSTEGLPGEVQVLVAVRDQRLGATDTPQVALASSMKRGIASLTACMADEVSFEPLADRLAREESVRVPPSSRLLMNGASLRPRAPGVAPGPLAGRYDEPELPMEVGAVRRRTGRDDPPTRLAKAGPISLPARGLEITARAKASRPPPMDEDHLMEAGLESSSFAPEQDAGESEMFEGTGSAALPQLRAAPAPEVRAQFPEVLFYGLVPVRGEQSVFVRLGDALASYTVEVFACAAGEWSEQRQTLLVDQPVRADLDVPSAVHPEDRVQGRLRVAASSGRAKVRVQLDGRALELSDAEGARVPDGAVVQAPALLSFPLRPGKLVAEVEDAQSGERDVVEALVGTPGRFKSYVRPMQLLQRGKSVSLDSEEALSLRVLPGVDEPFHALAEATADYGHACCEQTGAKLLSAVVLWLSAEKDDQKAKAERSVLAGIARERSMWRKGKGFAAYPDQSGVSEYYTPAVVRYLWTLEALRELPAVPPALARAVQEGLEMADDVARATRLQKVPSRIGSAQDAYAVARSGARKPEVRAFLEEHIDLQSAELRAAPARSVARQVLSRLVGTTPSAPASGFDPVEQRARLAYGAATLLLLGELGSALVLANVVLKDLNEQGRLYSTYDSVAAILLLAELRRAQVGCGAGRVRVNGREMSTAEAAALSESIETIEVLEGVAVVETLRIREEDWTAYSNELQLTIGFRDAADRKLSRVRLGDRVDLLVQLGKGYKMGDLVHVALPASMAWIQAGARVKRFTVDLEGKSELRVPVVVTHPIAGKEHFAICVRNMFEETRVTSPGLLSVQAA